MRLHHVMEKFNVVSENYDRHYFFYCYQTILLVDSKDTSLKVFTPDNWCFVDHENTLFNTC